MSRSDHQAFHEQFVQHQGSLFGYVATLVPSRSDAEEVFSRVSLILWDKWERFDQTRHFLPWARAIAFNEIRNFRRANRGGAVGIPQELLDQLADVRERHDELFEDRVAALKLCLAGLDGAERQLVELCYTEEKPIKDIAADHQTSPGSLYMKLHRIRQFLHECIDTRLAKGSLR